MATLPTRALAAALAVLTLAACAPDALTAPVSPEATSVTTVLTGPADARKPRALLSDDFSAYGTSGCLADGASFGPWLLQFNGYGCTSTTSGGTGGWMTLSPAAPTTASETHAALVVGPSYGGAYTYSVDVITDRQLRVNGAPNPWEVAWVVWNYTDNDHFYYLALKPNGWELGKRDPAYPGGQRFLATGAGSYGVGAWRNVVITTGAKDEVTVSVNGAQLVRFTDRERPYSSGRIGVYTEDAAVRATNVAVTAG